MIEQYVYDLIKNDPTLAGLLSKGESPDSIHLYPNVLPRGLTFDQAVTFTRIITYDAFPAIQAITIQFNIFTHKHMDGAAIGQALYDLFNQATNYTAGGISTYYVQRVSESDIDFNYDDKLYQREATYNFKVR